MIGATASKLATRMPISAMATVKNRARVGSPFFEALAKMLRNGIRLSRAIAWSNLGALKKGSVMSYRDLKHCM